MLEDTVVCGAVKLLVTIFGAAGLCPLSLAVVIQTAAILFEAYNARSLLYSDERRSLFRVKERKI